MPRSTAWTFGPCSCGGEFVARTVEVRMHTSTEAEFALAGIPQGHCERCGARVYKAETLERLEDVFAMRPRDSRLARGH